MYKKIFSVLLVAGTIALLVFLFIRYRIAPDLDTHKNKFLTVDNIPIQFEEGSSGKLIVFFQTWCGPCLVELNAWQQYLQTHSDVRVYAVTDEPRAKVLARMTYIQPGITLAFSDRPLKDLDIYTFPTVYYFKQGCKEPTIKKTGSFLPSDIP